MLHSVSNQSKMSLNPIIFYRYYDVSRAQQLWLTTTTVNTKMYFCAEPECYNEAHLSLGHLCTECYNRLAYPGAFEDEHVCNGEMDYELGYKICDDRDDPHCPQHRPRRTSVSTEPGCDCRGCELKIAADEMTGIGIGLHGQCEVCNREFQLVSPTVCRKICWFCKQATKLCADCGCPPKNGGFSCYRGDDPLCADCEEGAYGPPEEVDWRDRSGRCSKCDLFYDLYSSSDRRDLCYSCVKSDYAYKRCPDCNTSLQNEEEHVHEDGLSYCPPCWFERQR